jgi:hypothetical protein
MKTNKTQAILFLYQSLKENGTIKKNDFLSEIDITDLTFKRYVSELRCYLSNFDQPEELVYVKKNDCYILREISWHF